MKYYGNFFRNKDGIMSIEFAACFCLFSVLVFIIYDVYCSVMLQNKLERANYTVASIFRERSSIYPVIDGSSIQSSISSLCSNSNSCSQSHELFDNTQVEELRRLASSLLNGRDVALKIDGLFIFQDTNHPASIKDAKFATLSAKSCTSGTCNNEIENYFTSLPSITDHSNSSLSNYSKLVPYVPRITDPTSGLAGRWIPLYRVSMCIVNEESLYLKWINSSRKATDTLPNLCSNIVVLSRCGDILSSNRTSCPIYHL
ncbi:tight adherence pilus pseudopilin TadF [Gilliamella sp. BG7]|uniref:tight adherence pilus pseudopilin TadF n=1 Tax=unclassified Gilliamella TaxID=2685620 RepID=UPI003987E31C